MARRKKNKKKMTINKIFIGLTFVLSVILLLMLTVLNILPFKYLGIIYGGTLIFNIIICILLNKKKRKFGYFLSTIFIIVSSIAIYYLGVTNNFLSYFNKDNYKLETYLVLVLKDSNYMELNDLSDEDIGYVKNEITSINKAIEKLNKKVNINNVEYDNYNEAFKDTINHELQSIFIEESNYNMVIEENGDYADMFKILDKIKILTKIDNKKSNVNVAKDSFSIFVSGIDTYGDISSVGRSDVNMIITVNPKTRQMLLTSIPRDYYVQLHGTTGYKDKLTHAGIYGTDMSVETIEDLLNIDINYYFRVNFSTLEKIVDGLGGVDVYSEYSFVSFIGNYQFYKGYNHMTGPQALGFARERKTLPNGDINRAENQQAVVDGIVRKISNFSSVTKYSSLINSLNNTFQTNMKDTDITNLIKMQLSDSRSWNITSNVLIGEGASEYTYSYKGQKLYVMKPDSDSVEDAKKLINDVISGEVLESSYDKNASNVKNPNQVTYSNSDTNNTNVRKDDEEEKKKLEEDEKKKLEKDEKDEKDKIDNDKIDKDKDKDDDNKQEDDTNNDKNEIDNHNNKNSNTDDNNLDNNLDNNSDSNEDNKTEDSTN